MNYSDLTVWIIIAGIGAGSWALRFSFMGLLGDRVLPQWVMRHLRYTAVAIIPGLIAPMILLAPAGANAPDPARMAAAAVTLGVGVWSKNIFAALACGAAVFAVLLNVAS